MSDYEEAMRLQMYDRAIDAESRVAALEAALRTAIPHWERLNRIVESECDADESDWVEERTAIAACRSVLSGGDASGAGPTCQCPSAFCPKHHRSAR